VACRQRRKVEAAYAEGIVRLQSKLEKDHETTDANGRVSVRAYAWHACGVDQDPSSDNVLFEWPPNGRHSVTIWCGVKDLVSMQDNVGVNVRLAPGIRGRYALQSVINRMQKIGAAWDDVEEAPTSTGFPLYITDASTKWGGLSPPHFNHRFGGSIDLRVPSTDGNPSSPGAANYDRAGVKWLCQLLKWQHATEIRFSDKVEGVTVVDPTHNNHLHVSFLRDPSEPWRIEPAPKRWGGIL
jgi:hypothetical protein